MDPELDRDLEDDRELDLEVVDSELEDRPRYCLLALPLSLPRGLAECSEKRRSPSRSFLGCSTPRTGAASPPASGLQGELSGDSRTEPARVLWSRGWLTNFAGAGTGVALLGVAATTRWASIKTGARGATLRAEPGCGFPL